MILLDANIFMYAAGTAHPNKAPSASLIQRVARGSVEAAVDAEVLQEILHRYRAIGRWEDGRQVFDLARRIVPTVISITVDVVERARQILDENESASARDALHAAVGQTTGVTAICSYDRDFDEIAGIKRIEPDDVPGEEAEASVEGSSA